MLNDSLSIHLLYTIRFIIHTNITIVLHYRATIRRIIPEPIQPHCRGGVNDISQFND